MKTKTTKTNNKKVIEKEVALFENKVVRRTYYNEEWYFVILDIIEILSESSNPESYLKDMRRRNEELNKGWGQIATPLAIQTKGGVQKLNCSNIKGIFRIIQSIPSKKAEPFKLWLAKVGQERIEEIQDPERAILRAKSIYENKGYNEDWIAKRMRGINIRNTLTDQWKSRGVKEGIDFAILTNEIYKGTFDKTAKEYMEYKNLSKKSNDNLRDHFDDLELILTMLGEATTTEITNKNNSKGLNKLKDDAKEGGKIAGQTRVNIENKIGRKIVTKNNFKSNSKKSIE